MEAIRTGMTGLSARLRAHRHLLIWALVGLGALLRIRNFVSGRSLWLDEAFLALSLILRSPAELLRPLDYAQVVPVGYLLLLKAVADPFQYTEAALRFVSLLAGVATIPLGYLAARQYLTTSAAPLAVAFFALSPSLVTLSGDAKPYASDVALSLGLACLAGRALRDGLAPRSVGLFALVASAAIWLSSPAALVVAGAGAALFAVWWRAPTRRALVGLIAGGFVIAASGIAAYVVVFRHYLAANTLIRSEYAGGFMPLPPRTLAEFVWFPATFVGLFDDAGFGLPALAAFAFLVGAGTAWTARRDHAFVLLAPLLLAVAASALRVYPLYGRPAVFLAPALLLLAAEGADRIRRLAAPAMVRLALPVLLLLHPVILAVGTLVTPAEREEIRPVVEYLQAQRREGDLVYVYYGAQHALAYYAARLGLRIDDAVPGVAARTDWARYVADLEQLRGRPRVWVLFSHVYTRGGIDEERFLLHHLARMGTQLDAIRRTGASMYLFDLSASQADGQTHTAGRRPGPSTLAPTELEGWQRR